MNSKPLSKTNPHLKSQTERNRLVDRSVATSCGVEGIKVDIANMPKFKIPSRGAKRIYKTKK